MRRRGSRRSGSHPLGSSRGVLGRFIGGKGPSSRGSGSSTTGSMAFRSWVSRAHALLWVVAACDGEHERAGPADGATDAALVADVGSPTSASDEAGAKLSAQAVLAGACETMRIAADASKCVGLEQLVSCSNEKCDLATCMATCQEYLECVTSADQPCTVAQRCGRSVECSLCMSSVQTCSLAVTCFGLYSCATTTPGGACSKLQACCATQRMPFGCNMLALSAGMLRGDEECEKLTQNPGFVKVYASDPPCSME